MLSISDSMIVCIMSTPILYWSMHLQHHKFNSILIYSISQFRKCMRSNKKQIKSLHVLMVLSQTGYKDHFIVDKRKWLRIIVWVIIYLKQGNHQNLHYLQLTFNVKITYKFFYEPPWAKCTSSNDWTTIYVSVIKMSKDISTGLCLRISNGWRAIFQDSGFTTSITKKISSVFLNSLLSGSLNFWRVKHVVKLSHKL